MTNHQIFAIAIANRVVDWDAYTSEVIFRGVRFSMNVDTYGVPKLKESNICMEIIFMLPDTVYNLGEANPDNV